MEPLVVMALAIIIFCGFEIWNELKDSFVIGAKKFHLKLHVISAITKRVAHTALKQLHHPRLRLTTAYCVHTHRMHSSTPVHHTKHGH